MSALDGQTSLSSVASSLPTVTDKYVDPCPVNTSLWPKAKQRCDHLLSTDHQVSTHRLPTDQQKTVLLASRTSIEFLSTACSLYSPRTAYVQHTVHCTYSTLWTRILNTAAALSIPPLSLSFQPASQIGIYGGSCIDWVVIHYVLMYLGCVTIPLQSTSTADELRHCMTLTDMTVLFCEQGLWDNKMHTIITHNTNRRLPQTIILYRGNTEQRTNIPAPAHDAATVSPTLSVFFLSDLEHQQLISPSSPPSMFQADPSSLILILYTSGSTGSPKAVMYAEHFVCALFVSALHPTPPWANVPRIGYNYLPLSHNSGWIHLHQVLLNGGVTYFPLKQDLSEFVSDIQSVAPTHLILVPRVSSMIYQQFQTSLIERQHTHAQQNGANGSTTGSIPGADSLAESIQCEWRYKFFGPRLLFILIGTAPTEDAVWMFLSGCFHIPIYHVYGTTESWPALFCDHRIRPDAIANYRLEAVPSMHYLPTDQPYPRGELWLQLYHHSDGYYHDETATQSLYSEDGQWFKTGDIMECRGPGHLVWIDRKNAVIKLAQGEFVAISKLEQTFATHTPHIHQIFIYGNSQESYLLAVIVPNINSLSCSPHFDDGVRMLLSQELTRIGQQCHLLPYEIPQDFVLESTAFSTANGLLTESNKPARYHLTNKYKQQLDTIYHNHKTQRLWQKAQFIQHSTETKSNIATDMKSLIRDAFALVLHLDRTQPSASHLLVDEAHSVPFINAGGDSISAVELCDWLDKICHVTVSVPFLFCPSLSVYHLIEQIHQMLQQQTQHLDQHTETQTETGTLDNYVKDVDILTHQLPPRCQPHPPPPPPPTTITTPTTSTTTGSPHLTVFLTGVTGFLGLFIFQALLQSPDVAQIILLVRDSNPQAALQRLRKTAAKYQQSWSASAESRMTVLCGEVSKEQLGLSLVEWDRVCEAVDIVIHCAAMVHWLYPYDSLKQTNVLSTIYTLQLSATHHHKPYVFVSSNSVFNTEHYFTHFSPDDPSSLSSTSTSANNSSAAHQPSLLHATTGVSEDDDLEASRIGLSGGYGQSKWVSEKLLFAAHHRGFPIYIIRPGYILGHSTTGVCNVNDFVWRLVKGCIQLGVAPDLSHNRINACTVDHVASVVVTVALHPPPVVASSPPHLPVYQLNQPNVFRFTDLFHCVQQAGYAVNIVPYDVWRQALLELSNTSGSTNRNSNSRIVHPSGMKQSNALYPLLPYVTKDLPVSTRSLTLDDSHTQTLWNTVYGAHSYLCPALDSSRVSLYLKYLQRIGFLIPAAATTSAEV